MNPSPALRRSLARLVAAGFAFSHVGADGWAVYAWTLPTGRVGKRLAVAADGSVRSAR